MCGFLATTRCCYTPVGDGHQAKPSLAKPRLAPRQEEGAYIMATARNDILLFPQSSHSDEVSNF